MLKCESEAWINSHLVKIQFLESQEGIVSFGSFLKEGGEFDLWRERVEVDSILWEQRNGMHESP